MSLSVLFEAPLLSFSSPASTGQWIAFKRYSTPISAMLYDGETGRTIIWEAKNGSFRRTEVDGVVTLKGMTWPKSQYKFKLRWTVLEATKEAAENAVYLDGPKKGQKLYKSVRTFQHSDIVIAVREEDGVPYLREKEIHPIAIEFNCKGGGSYVIIAQITTVIENPLVSIQLERLLDAGIGPVTEAILKWGKSMTFQQAQNIDVDDKKQILLKDENGTDQFFLDVINKHLKSVGLNVPDVTILDHFIGDNSKEVFKSQNETLIAEQEVAQAEFDTQARLKLNTAQVAENTTELAYDTALLKQLEKTQVAILKEEAKVAGAYVGSTSKLQYLNTGGGSKEGASSIMDLFFAMKKDRQTKKGGKNAA